MVKAIYFVSKCAKTKYVCNWFIIIHSNQSRALCCSICWTRVCSWLIEDGQNGGNQWGFQLELCGRYPWGLRAHAFDTMVGALHVSHCSCWAVVQILVDQFFADKWTLLRSHVPWLSTGWKLLDFTMMGKFTPLALILTEWVKQARARWTGGGGGCNSHRGQVMAGEILLGWSPSSLLE